MNPNQRTSEGERIITKAKTGLDQNLKRAEYINLIYQLLLVSDTELPSLKALRLNEARQLATHLNTLNIIPKEILYE